MRTRLVFALVLPLASWAACAPPPPAAPPTVVEMPPIAQEAPAPDPTQPLTLPPSGLTPRWHEEPASDERSPLDDVRLVEAGQKAALVRTRIGEVFVVHEDRGVLGSVPLPAGSKWIGTDDQDRVYAATDEGELWVADGPDDAVQGKLVHTGGIKGAVDWDYTAGMVVTALGDKVFVSRDRGASFTASTPRKGAKVRTVFARFDGAVAVQIEDGAGKGKRDVYLSRDRGKSWQKSAFSPRSLRRDGAFVWNGDVACPAILSADGRGFTVDRARHAAFEMLPSWSGLLLASAKPRPAPPATRLRIASPLPPASTTGKGQQSPALCERERLAALSGGVVGGVLGGIGFGSIGVLSEGAPCRGPACLAGTVHAVPEPTRTAIELFYDGICKDTVGDGKACAPNSPFARLPHVARSDRTFGQVKVESLPAGCEPERIESIGGLGLLFCKGAGDTSAVFTSQSPGAWAAEGSLPVRTAEVWAITLAPDGGLMLHATCPRGVPCRALVRAPKPPGDASAWRAVAVPGAIAYRVVDDGGALAVVPAASGRRFSLVLAAPGAEPRPLTGEIDAGDRDLHDLHVDAAGHVIVMGGTKGNRPGSWQVTLGGVLEPLARPEAPATGKPIHVRPRPIDPARVP